MELGRAHLALARPLVRADVNGGEERHYSTSEVVSVCKHPVPERGRGHLMRGEVLTAALLQARTHAHTNKHRHTMM